MNTQQDAFNKEITDTLKYHPNTDMSKTINIIKQINPNSNNYYSLFDNACYKMGMDMMAVEYADIKTDKTLGYIPTFRFYKDNMFREKPSNQELVSSNSPMKLDDCYAFLAKHSLYRLMHIANLDELLNTKK